MIILYTGNPRSGKSYRMVYELLRSEVQDKYFILHDIDGLKHEKFTSPVMLKRIDELCRDEKIDYHKLLTLEYMNQLHKDVLDKYGRPILLILDECHMTHLADIGRKNNEARDFLSYHGHYGMEVWLSTQGKNQIHSDFRALIGMNIHAKKGAIIPFFWYSHKDGAGVTIGAGKKLPKKQEIFDCYKSFHLAEARQRKSMMLPIIGGVMVVSVLFVVWYMRNPFKAVRDGNIAGASPAAAASVASGSARTPAISKRDFKSLPLPERLEHFRYAGSIGGNILLQDVHQGTLKSLEEWDLGVTFMKAERRRILVHAGPKFYWIASRPVDVAAQPVAREGGTREHATGSTALPE